MTKPEALLRPTPAGLYCLPGDFYIDPVAPVARALITHGHGDHARSGHEHVMATPATLAIMGVRYGEEFARAVQPVRYGESQTHNGVTIKFLPAGHVLGSAQIALSWKNLSITVSGDFKRRRDPTCEPFEAMPCDVFVSEATFGLPVFRHPPDMQEMAKLLRSREQFPDRAHLVGVYALGKAQRVICLLREAGYDAPLYVHGALVKLNALYERFGVKLGPLLPASEGAKKDFAGQIILAPLSAIADRWSRRFPDPVTAFASGWMRVRARARQRGVELPLILSDHADWDELTQTIEEIHPGELWITHGQEDGLLRWAAQNNHAARALELVGYEEEDPG